MYFTRLMRSFSDIQIVSFKKNELANANELYTLTAASNDKYVIKFLDTQSTESVKTEMIIQENVKDVGLGTPQYVPLKNGSVVGDDYGRSFVLYKYLPGNQAVEVSKDLIYNMGITIAKIHHALQGVTMEDNNVQWLSLVNAKAELARYSGQLKASLSKLLADNSYILRSALPQALVHGDLTLSNILVKDRDVTAVFDFETAQNTVRILDIARTFLSLKRMQSYSSKDILTNLVAGYDSWSPCGLTNIERESLGAAINYTAAACAAWCVNNQQVSSAEAYLNITRNGDWL
jgi:Ser/Thr protein kinase RdoA (MazF antagonist)